MEFQHTDKVKDLLERVTSSWTITFMKGKSLR